MTAEEIKQYLRELNDELALQNVKGEICLYGGAVMCLVFKARPATKDVKRFSSRSNLFAMQSQKLPNATV